MTNKPLDYYLRLPYRVDIYPDEDGKGYTAVVPDLPGCMTSADTIDELWPMLQEAKRLWIEVALQDGDRIPEPPPVRSEPFSGRFVLRVPRSLHRQLASRATDEGTSLNQLVVSLLSGAMGRWAAGQVLYSPQYPSATRLAWERLVFRSLSAHALAPVQLARFPLPVSNVIWRSTSPVGQLLPASRSSYDDN